MFSRLHEKCLCWLKKKFDSDQFTYAELRRMFIPLLLDQIFIYGILILSSAMVSSSGEGAMAAVSLGNTISSFTYALHSAVAIGGGIVIARAKGAGNQEGIRRAIGQCCWMCTLFGSAIALTVSAFSLQILQFFYPDTDSQVIQMGSEYLRIYGYSVVPYTLFNVIFTVFRSLGDTKGSLILTLIINPVHLICSLIFINVLHMGVAGSAYSYLTARTIGVIFAMYWLMRKKCIIGVRWKDFFACDRGTAKDVFQLGIPLSIEQVLFQGGMLLVTMYLAKLPVAQMDAQGVTNSVFMLYYVFGYALTAITSTVCGQCIGAKDIDLAKRYCKSFVTVGRIIMMLAVVVLFPMTPLVLKLYSPSQASTPYIYMALALSALPMPFVWCDAFVPACLTRAAGDASYTTVVAVCGLIVGRLLLGYLFTIVLGLGMPGIWLGQSIEWLLRNLVFRHRLSGTKWVKVN